MSGHNSLSHPQPSESMALNYSERWRYGFEPVAAVPSGAVDDLHGLILRIARIHPEQRWNLVERFQKEIAEAGGDAARGSSSLEWAQADLRTTMGSVAKNGPAFIDGFWAGITAAESLGFPVPSAHDVNRILKQHDVPYIIRPPDLVLREQEILDAKATSPGTPASPLQWSYSDSVEIGKGGFGVVYRVTRQTSVGPMEYALKLLNPSPFVGDPGRARERFTREVNAIIKMQHRGIISYIDVGFDSEERPFLVMPLIEGVNYKEDSMRRPLVDRAELMIEVLYAVEYAHTQGVFHRDIKPSNVLVRKSDGQPIIIDFGQAFLLEEAPENSLTTQGIGSLGYLPPEVIVDPKQSRSAKHDIYSCGIMLFESFVGRRPDPMDIPSLANIDESLKVLDAVVRRALAKASERYTDAATFAGELTEAVEKIRSRV